MHVHHTHTHHDGTTGHVEHNSHHDHDTSYGGHGSGHVDPTIVEQLIRSVAPLRVDALKDPEVSLDAVAAVPPTTTA
jgi:hypothetical protein